MATAVVFTVRAERKLMKIIGFIAQDDPVAAFRVVEDLRKRVNETLTVFPDAGSMTPGGQRQFAVRRYTFIYRHDAAKREVVVLNVFGPGEDWR